VKESDWLIADWILECRAHCVIWGEVLCVCVFGIHAYFFERLAQLPQDVLLVEHLALEAVLVVLVDLLPHVRRQLVEGHVLLHLLVLE